MKWIVLGLVGILLVIFWPRGELGGHRNPLERAQSPTAQETSRSSRPAGSARRIRGERSISLSDEELHEIVLKLWPDILNDLSGREPAVVELIQTLRELGKRDGPGTLSFLDDLDRSGNESAILSEILEKAKIRPPYSPPPRFIVHDD